MLPTLTSGQRLFTFRLPRRFIRRGMLAVVRTRAGDIVKRIADINETTLTLISDNNEVTSQFNGQPLSLDALVGIVVWPPSAGTTARR